MRQIIAALLGASALSIASVPGTRAADIPVSAPAAVKAPAAVVAGAYNWTSFYAGLNVGGAWSHANVDSSTIYAPPADWFGSPSNVAQFNAVGAQRDKASGFTGGAQAGFNWQAGNFVTGLETDFQYFHQHGVGTASGILPTSGNLAFTISQSFSTDWLWTLRPRLGVAANNWLFYATGGLALTKLKANWQFMDAANESEFTSLSKTRTGWTVGGGVEYALSNAWSLKAEYLYLNFGDAQITTNNILDGASPVPRQPVFHSVSLASNIVRVGLNYQFH